VTIDLRCSTWARREGVHPIGTAGSFAGYLLVPWPLPWPRDVTDIKTLGPVAARARDLGYRLLALVPQPGESARTLRCYRWHPGQGRYVGHSVTTTNDVAGTAWSLLEGEPLGRSEIKGTDVLICGHGRRDRCCGSIGTALQMGIAEAGGLGSDVRVFRTSHTGGHRFAPTAIVLPSGTCWGYLDEEALGRIVTRSTDHREDLFRYRGCTGLLSPRVQALEREVLEHIGWNLLDCGRRGTDRAGDLARLTITDPDLGPRTFEGRVLPRRRLPVPECGVAIGQQSKTQDELFVTDFREIEED